jgi:AraC-like DNA-binding protein
MVFGLTVVGRPPRWLAAAVEVLATEEPVSLDERPWGPPVPPLLADSTILLAVGSAAEREAEEDVARVRAAWRQAVAPAVRVRIVASVAAARAVALVDALAEPDELPCSPGDVLPRGVPLRVSLQRGPLPRPCWRRLPRAGDRSARSTLTWTLLRDHLFALTEDELASTARLSVRTVRRDLGVLFGDPPYPGLVACRVETGLRLLTFGLPLATVGPLVGYATGHAFADTVRRVTGGPPLARVQSILG